MEEKKTYRFFRMGRGGIVANQLGYEKTEDELTTEELDTLLGEIVKLYNNSPLAVKKMFIERFKAKKLL